MLHHPFTKLFVHSNFIELQLRTFVYRKFAYFRRTVVTDADLQPEGSCNGILASEKNSTCRKHTQFGPLQIESSRKYCENFFASQKLVFLSTSITTSQRETLNFSCISACSKDTNDTPYEGILEICPPNCTVQVSSQIFRTL